MTPTEKVYNQIKEWFILTDRDFLKLSEQNQNELIISMIQMYADNLRNEK